MIYTSSERASSPIWSDINEFVYQKNTSASLNLETYSIRSDLFGPAAGMLLQRLKLMSQIEEKLRDRQGIQALALVGPGGAGKTTIARGYGRTQKLPLVWEINAETKENLINSFECLAYALSKTEEEKKILKGVQEIKNAQERKGRENNVFCKRKA
jgi:ABC-type glutathione transport system ATPase component